MNWIEILRIDECWINISEYKKLFEILINSRQPQKCREDHGSPCQCLDLHSFQKHVFVCYTCWEFKRIRILCHQLAVHVSQSAIVRHGSLDHFVCVWYVRWLSVSIRHHNAIRNRLWVKQALGPLVHMRSDVSVQVSVAYLWFPTQTVSAQPTSRSPTFRYSPP